MKSKLNFSGAFKEVEAYAKGKKSYINNMYRQQHILLLHRYNNKQLTSTIKIF